VVFGRCVNFSEAEFICCEIGGAVETQMMCALLKKVTSLTEVFDSITD
jgi:hypothetical protein